MRKSIYTFAAAMIAGGIVALPSLSTRLPDQQPLEPAPIGARLDPPGARV